MADPDRVLRAFLDAEGRLRLLPARRAKRLVVLDHLARVFEPGERYAETEVNAHLRAFHDDVALLRRALVDEGFMMRADGTYWRSGGSVDVSEQAGSEQAGSEQAGSEQAGSVNVSEQAGSDQEAGNPGRIR